MLEARPTYKAQNTRLEQHYENHSYKTNTKSTICHITRSNLILEMDRSSANAELRPQNLAECSAWIGNLWTIRPKSGKKLASILRVCVCSVLR